MKKFTLVTLLAQPSQPVFTHDCLFTLGVSKRTQWSPIAHVSHKIFTHCCSRFCRTKHHRKKKTQQSINCHLNQQSFYEKDHRFIRHKCWTKKKSESLTGFGPMTSNIPVGCSNQPYYRGHW